jgi:elongation factor G
MKDYHTDNLRNIALIGHGSEGKTALAEAMQLVTGAIDRVGGVMDYDPEEQKREISIGAAIAPVEWKDVKINLIDVPGYFDFIGEMMGPLSVADTALIVMGATSGLNVGTEKAFYYTGKYAVPRVVVVNAMDKENADYDKCVSALTEKYGAVIAPILLPIMAGGAFTGIASVVENKAWAFQAKGALKECPVPEDVQARIDELREVVIEAAAGSDDALMEKYFEEGTLSDEELQRGLRGGIAAGMIVPVVCSSATGLQGVASLLDMIAGMLPSPAARGEKTGVSPKSDAEEKRPCDASAPFSAQVFKSVADPFVGKLSLIKVISGTLSGDTALYNANSEHSEKAGSISTMRGKKLTSTDKLIAGDIGVLAKLQYTSTGDTLCDAGKPIRYPAIDFPKPSISLGVAAKNSNEEDKVVSGLNRLREEDPSMSVEKSDFAETIISGQGELHLEIITRKLAQKFGVECVLYDPKIPYRETIRTAIKAEGRHKKQSGGHGQFGHVWIEFEPFEGDFEFVDKVVGGVVPRQFIPAVEKGLRENLHRGIVAGYPLVGIRATLYDGSYHAVDSSEMAFKTAARLAMRKMADAKPAILEPIYHVEVVVPDEHMGDIIGDMNRRRGRILGMNQVEDGQQVVVEVPQNEMFKYATDLRSMTQARGSFTMEFERYEEVPGNIAQKIIESAKLAEDEDE